MTPDEVRMLDNRYALLFIRGERPVMDLKYDILKHPAIDMTEDGKTDPYIHGEAYDAAFSLQLTYDADDIAYVESMESDLQTVGGDYVLLSEEDVEKLVDDEEKMENGHDEKNKREDY